MKAVVIYESWFGNTKAVAEAIAGGIGFEDVVLAEAGKGLPDLDDVDLFVVGGPTHAHGLSSASTRKGALQRGADGDLPGEGIRGFLQTLPPGDGRAAAAFDTRADMPIVLTGSASRGIAKRLRRLGYELVAPAESFVVTDTEGPLKDGELDRAAAWATTLVVPAVRA
jgi:flavodoxin